MAAPAPHLVDEILEEIFLRLPTPSELARVSTACPRFHRIITERPFLRRYRKLHPPPLLGLVSDEDGFFPVQAPHPSAPLARALADAADFTYSFLPEPECSLWVTCDARDGRVLVKDDDFFPRLVVCDPLSRRYVMLPPIPKDMAAQQDSLVDLGHKLAQIGEDDEDVTSFKVICPLYYESKLIVLVFSSVTGQWCIAASASWSSLGIADPSWKSLEMPRCNYVRHCLYWENLCRDKFPVLDMDIMEFSTVDVVTGYNVQLRNQPGHSQCISTIVDGTKGALEMVTLARHHSRNSCFLYRTTQQNNGESSNEWQLKNVKELPSGWFYDTMGATEDFLFLRCDRGDQRDDLEYGSLPVVFNFYSLEVKTFELKELCMAPVHPSDFVHSYFAFPPSLSKPSL